MRSLFTLAILTAVVCSVSAQSKSAIEFFDSTGSNQVSKFGWSGSKADGKFFIETATDSITVKNGAMSVSGTLTAKKFTGDGSGLTNLPGGTGGTPGPAGPTGATGPAGPAGTAGATGAAGPAGPQGPKGDTGVAGPVGPIGPAGPAGAAGAAGAVGATGAAGPAGTIGVTGAQGIQGIPGVNGYEVITTAMVREASGAYISGTATCPAGKKIISGGYTPTAYRPNKFADFAVMRNYPLTNGTGWSVTVYDPDTGFVSANICAVCAQVQ